MVQRIFLALLMFCFTISSVCAKTDKAWPKTLLHRMTESALCVAGVATGFICADKLDTTYKFSADHPLLATTFSVAGVTVCAHDIIVQAAEDDSVVERFIRWCLIGALVRINPIAMGAGNRMSQITDGVVQNAAVNSCATQAVKYLAIASTGYFGPTALLAALKAQL